MRSAIRSVAVLAAAVCLAGSMGFAQSSGGAATYKAKCQVCHGVTGIPSLSMGKAMGIKPVSDPEIQKLSADQMIASVKKGKGKMKPIVGLTDAQITDVVSYFRTLK